MESFGSEKMFVLKLRHMTGHVLANRKQLSCWTFWSGMTLPFSPKIHLLCMLVVKKMGVCVTHISRSVMARLMMKMLAGVRRLRLLQSKKKINHRIPLTSQQPTDARNADATWHHGRAMKTAVRSTRILPAECVDDQEVADHARDADGEDD